tara:strand:+ start:2208 stop:3860 length:1653 start_codon:yes stop_codon:yes gene_type:complete
MARGYKDYLDYFGTSGVERPAWDDIPGGNWANDKKRTYRNPNNFTPNVDANEPHEASGTDLNSGSVDIPNEKDPNERDPRLIGEYRSWYRDPDSGTRYEGSAKGVRDKIVKAKMEENEAAGKYNKKGWFAKTRGNIERHLDKQYGGDWDPYEEDYGTIRDDVKEGINKNERQFLANEGIRIGNRALDEQKETTENRYQDFQDWMGEFNSGGKGFSDTPEYMENDPPETDLKVMQKNANAAYEADKKKYYRDENNQLQEAGDAARDSRVESEIREIDPGELLSENQELGVFSGRYKVEAGDGSKLTAISDDKHQAFHDPKSGLLYNKKGDTIGFSSGPGKFHWQKPDKSIAGWGVNIGDLNNPDTERKESGLYGYGGQTEVKGADPGAYFDKYGGGPSADWDMNEQMESNDAYTDSNEMVQIKEEIKKKTSDFTMEQGPDGKMHKKYKRSKEDEDMSKELERVARAAGWDGSDSSWITDPLQHDLAQVQSGSGKPYNPMDLGGDEDKWGWRGRPYNPYAKKGQKSLGHKKIKEPAWITATRLYYAQRNKRS